MFLAIFLPPVSVFFNASNPLVAMFCNIILCLLGWIPGIIHAFYVRSASQAEKGLSETKQLMMEQSLLLAREQGDEKTIKKIEKSIQKEKDDRFTKAGVPFFVIFVLILLFYYL